MGIFEEKEFWSLMKELPLEALGLTEHEIDAMMEFSEWVSDGKVNYHEAIFELADSVLTFIESKKTGETDVLTVVTDLSKDGAHTAKSEKKVARHESVEEIMEVPDYFLQYIYDTFFAYDFDNNGYLCKDELDAVLPVLNIAMTYKDFIAEEVSVDLIFFLFSIPYCYGKMWLHRVFRRTRSFTRRRCRSSLDGFSRGFWTKRTTTT